jgi:hypothetical protein
MSCRISVASASRVAARHGSGSGRRNSPAAKSAMSARAVNFALVRHSSNEVLASRFAPCNPVQPVSPIAFR